ncbi:hypothetical protein ACFWAY_18150 [Rhodococcus sp. NPDC059968]|uniref:hypothetical protein n=1 Tax=Rhodococcus sp. NPDC059968 TaxID=3347017 RepID=UPI00366D8DFF
MDPQLDVRSGAGRRRCILYGQVRQRLVAVGADAAGISGHGARVRATDTWPAE